MIARSLPLLLFVACIHTAGPDIVPLEVKAELARRAHAAERAHLELTVTPRICLAPCYVTATLRLVGERGIGRFYCASTAWHWGENRDVRPSTRVADCDPHELGTPIERSWVEHHVYRKPGDFLIRFAAGPEMAEDLVLVRGVGW